jgi:hypothetical protein
MDKNLEKVIDIMNEEYEKAGKWYALFAIEFDWTWNRDLRVNCSLDMDQMIITKYMIWSYIDSSFTNNGNEDG